MSYATCCLSFKHGEYNGLVCCREQAHEGEHNYVVASKGAIAERERRKVIAAGFAAATDAEVYAEFKRRNPPPPNPMAPTMREKRGRG